MQIFPFNHNETIQTNNLENFKAELKKITVKKLNHEHSRVKFYGKLSNKGFLIEPKLKYFNFWRPDIKGTYDTANHAVHITLNVKKRVFIILALWLGMGIIPLLFSDAENKLFFGLFVLSIIPSFWYIGGLVFYSIDVHRVKESIQILRDFADDTVPKS